MRNTMEVEGDRAVIQFDPDIDMFRGEFVGLNGDADFHARDTVRQENGASRMGFRPTKHAPISYDSRSLRRPRRDRSGVRMR